VNWKIERDPYGGGTTIRVIYIRDFDHVAGTTTTAMLELYPDRVNPGGALWLSARAVKS
jgi:hypothetical protein